MQKHWDVMRSDDAGDSWHEVSGNLPTDFGFPIDVHAHEPETIYVVPIKSDSEHFPPDGKLRVYRSRTRRQRMGSADERPAAKRLLRERPARRDGRRFARSVRRLLRHHRRAGVRSADAGDNWAADRPRSSGRCCPSRSRRCHDPRHAAAPPAQPRASRRRGAARRRRRQSRSARCSTRSKRAIRCCAGRSATTARTSAARSCASSPATRICRTNRPTRRCRKRSRRAPSPL